MTNRRNVSGKDPPTPYLAAEPVVLNSEGVEKVLKKNTQYNNLPLVTLCGQGPWA
jgi:hypothetical protein